MIALGYLEPLKEPLLYLKSIISAQRRMPAVAVGGKSWTALQIGRVINFIKNCKVKCRKIVSVCVVAYLTLSDWPKWNRGIQIKLNYATTQNELIKCWFYFSRLVLKNNEILYKSRLHFAIKWLRTKIAWNAQIGWVLSNFTVILK